MKTQETLGSLWDLEYWDETTNMHKEEAIREICTNVFMDVCPSEREESEVGIMRW